MPPPRALELAEIGDIVEAYRVGAENAKAAGFDGVEVHGANRYLLEQFLLTGSNQRTDEYGGSVENRARLLLEVTDAVIEVWGAGRVGVHLSPRFDMHDMSDANRTETFSYVAKELGKRGIAFICARERDAEDSLGPQLKKDFGGVYIANEKFTKDTANTWLAEGKADAIAFGVPYIANPDLPERLASDARLNEAHPETFYGKGPVGYIDYPRLKHGAATAKTLTRKSRGFLSPVLITVTA
ncbi:Xenobiotic reductase B [Pseudomonas amygdali pv. sesami]|nr:Xenobiotic reductase B [Pseudomonas amygdali pv. sesami]